MIDIAERLAEHLYGHSREKAIEWAKEDKFDSCYRQAEDIIALLGLSWISVSHGMPQLSDFRSADPTKPKRVRNEILVATKNGRVFETIFTGLGFANVGYHDEVTHWMPIPTHPTASNETP